MRERKKKRVTMMGKKLSTLPTPSKMPETMRLWMVGLTLAEVSAPSTRALRPSMPEARRSCKKAPITLKVR